MSDPATEPNEEIKWDEVYNDPTATVIFVSSDKVHFRAHGWPLKRHSQVFSDMLTLPQNESTETPLLSSTKPIELDVWNDILRFFLDLFHSSSPPTLDVQLGALKLLLKLCDRFQAEALKHKALEGFMRFTQKDPIGTFALAAQCGHVELAAASIKHFSEYKGDPWHEWYDTFRMAVGAISTTG
ncbi:hypothetical protein TREMEDRAFT_63928 [Tremella mesenterica DSM 1558]|uniref:uncharacterized protein n=1 Tax=Tremella mesenterica (strain ATCC 24925 / CBS 8224 / DSM 1558 / NBRC 9311 / NRRL Y-6157 / RJB 2259-6 / UBC 559-6) TaxID=578456 RepID=UPI0003F4A15F|nr:uncharacterized protein TREMEDRAFT_63928 [Tremella mesenterica DSM 1558]EIW68042.1 hypothetical protein TREMEDRAFT_63928 [Tremella mesenterica DSM 1558]